MVCRLALWKLWRAEEHEGENGNLGEPLETDISGPLALDALCKLLSATPNVLVIPLLPRIRNFIKGVDDDSTVVLRDLTRLDDLGTLKYARFSCNLVFD